MTKYLKFDKSESLLTVVSERPLPPYAEFKSDRFFGGKFGVFHDNFPNIEQALARIQTLSGCGEYIRAAQHAALQLAQLYHKDGTLFVSLGASPKIIKWALDCYGFAVANVNASAMSKLDDNAPPTQDFIEYVKRKLKKRFVPSKIVLMDYANTGKSLMVMRNMIRNYIPDVKDARIIMVATGPGRKFVDLSLSSSSPSDDVIQVLKGVGIKNLSAAFDAETFKMDWFGRRKEKNDYANWSANQATVLSESFLEKKEAPAENLPHFMNKKQSEVYAEQKKFVKHVMRSNHTAPIIYGADGIKDDEDGALTSQLKILSKVMEKTRIHSVAHNFLDFVPEAPELK